MGFARYGFNRAHAADYAVIVARPAYLKAYYPVEYMAALLTVERHDTEKVGLLIAECRRMGIEVLPPNVNVSGHSFTVEQLPAGPHAAAPGHRLPVPGGAGRGHPHGAGCRSRTWAKAGGGGPAGARRPALCAPWPTSPTGWICARSTAAGWSVLIKVGALDDFGERGQLLAAIDRIMGASESGARGSGDRPDQPVRRLMTARRADDLLADLPARAPRSTPKRSWSGRRSWWACTSPAIRCSR